MRTLRLHGSLYPAAAIEQAVAIFADYGQFELVQDAPYTEVRLTAAEGVDEGQLAGELGNHALTLAAETWQNGADRATVVDSGDT